MKDNRPGRMGRRRKLIQLYAALLYNAHLKGYVEGNIYTGPAKTLCVPGLNCYSCPGAVGSCPLGALQNALASTGNRAPFYVLGILLLMGMTLGRTICGWLCPVGLGQELLHRIPTPKVRKNRVTRMLSHLKYIILALFVIILPLVYGLRKVPLPAFCKYICPAGTLGGAVQLLIHPANADKFAMLGIHFTWKWVVLAAVVLASVFIYRAFCRFLCPLGAIYSLFNRFALTGIRVDDEKCVHCGQCVARCPMDVKKVCDRECISCGQCIGVCPRNAISLRAGKRVLIGETEAADREAGLRPLGTGVKKAAADGMALLLAGMLIWTNLPETAKTAGMPIETAKIAEIAGAAESPDSTAVRIGHEVGQTAPDFTLVTTAGETFQLSDYRGKTVFLNLWATWCGPCVKELPYFEQLQKSYPEDAVILAIHSNLVTEDVQAYLSGYDYHFAFAIDETGEVITSLGGSAMLPQTVVIDREGTVIYNQTGSVTYEKLEALMEP